MRKVEEIAQNYGLTVEWGNSVHLLRGTTGIASVHDTGLENDLCINQAFEQGSELFLTIAREIFGVVPTGPVEWLAVREGTDL